MTKILFTNTNCSWNKGSAAQVISTTKILKKFIPDASFTLISYCPELDSKPSARYNIKTVGYLSRSPLKALLYLHHLSISLVRCIFWKILSKLCLNAVALLNEKYLKEYVKADIIIDLSGDSFSDGRGNFSPLHSLTILLGVLLKKPIALFSQSIGPFKKWTLPLAKFCLDRVNLIIVREELTKKYLENIKIKSHIYLTADCAFVLESAPYGHIKQILLKENINKDGDPLIGISVSAMLDDKNDNYVSLMAQITDCLIEKMKAQVVFIPHVVSMTENGVGDDRVVANKIYRKAANKGEIKLIKNKYSPEELKGIIGLCDMFIGARMHANIAALSSHVPTMAIAWSHKYYGIMKAVGQEKYVCDSRTMRFDTLVSKINELWRNKNEIREELASKIKTQKELAWFSGKLVKNLLHS